VFGLKPHQDRVWHGPMNWKGMAVNGPLCRTVEDAALFLDVAAESDTSFVEGLTEAPTPLRIAIAFRYAEFWPTAARLGAEQRDAVERTAGTLRQLGHHVEPREVGFPQSMSTNYIVRYLSGVAESFATLDRPEAVSTATRQMAALGKRIPERVVRSMIDGQDRIAAKVNRIFDDFDVVLTPGAVQEPLKVGVLDGKDALRTLFASGRIAGRAHDEATLLRLSAQLETANPWTGTRPSV